MVGTKHHIQDWREREEKFREAMRKNRVKSKACWSLCLSTGIWFIRTLLYEITLNWQKYYIPKHIKKPNPCLLFFLTSFPALLTPPIICEQHVTVHVLAKELSQGVCHCRVLIVCLQHPDFVPSLAHRRWNEMVCRKIQVAFITKSMLPL